jgi:hypothetical protein
MRRSVILGLSTAIATAAMMLLTASSAVSIVICPVTAAHGAAGGPDMGTCCGPPIVQAMSADFTPAPPCCPGNAMCVQMLTISSSPNPSDATQKVTLTGTVSGAAATPGTTVTIWQRLPGQSGFSKLSDATPDGSGNYSLSESPTTNLQWYATANGERSATIQQLVQAQVFLTASRTKRGGVVFHARVWPAHAHARVALEAGSGTTWKALTHAHLNNRSKATFSFLALFGTARTFRVTFLGDSRNVRSSSAPLTLPRH